MALRPATGGRSYRANIQLTTICTCHLSRKVQHTRHMKLLSNGPGNYSVHVVFFQIVCFPITAQDGIAENRGAKDEKT